jgi:hypothetical protein
LATGGCSEPHEKDAWKNCEIKRHAKEPVIPLYACTINYKAGIEPVHPLMVGACLTPLVSFSFKSI